MSNMASNNPNDFFAIRAHRSKKIITVPMSEKEKQKFINEWLWGLQVINPVLIPSKKEKPDQKSLDKMQGLISESFFDPDDCKNIFSDPSPVFNQVPYFGILGYSESSGF